ncbi:MAG: AbrB/MazE/SpoVT family DNA-binding domain-containing protein [Candidatus Methanoperedens sp.]|nr:AbrB/MazE/SpoVT family DNA-binding domain-containing protein [Candidatus Methanoperedens sp.]
METSKVSIKGQIVIPSRLRKKYGFKTGEKVTFIEEDKYIIIKPKTKLVDLCGSVKPLYTPEEARKKLREMRENWR